MEEENNKTTSYLSLFATTGNRKRMKIIIAIAVFSQWRWVTLNRRHRATGLELTQRSKWERARIILYQSRPRRSRYYKHRNQGFHQRWSPGRKKHYRNLSAYLLIRRADFQPDSRSLRCHVDRLGRTENVVHFIEYWDVDKWVAHIHSMWVKELMSRKHLVSGLSPKACSMRCIKPLQLKVS